MKTYAAARRKLIDNEAKHDELMAEIAKRGGKTLKQLREIKSMKEKDEFISKYRRSE